MEIYHSITVYSTDEILMALLTRFDLDSIEENDDHFVIYIKSSFLTDDVKSEIEKLIRTYNAKYNIQEIVPQNWNAIWEASFQPVIVGDYCQVRADFHPADPNIKYDLIINPKMAFGTGHHATTYMMIEHMSTIDFTGKKVLDFGCGTGILAILASKSGAAEIDAIDIEHESYLNTMENADINNVDNILSIEGELSAAPSHHYDIVLANINRNILQRYATNICSMMNAGSYLLLSGILEEDAAQIINTFTSENLTPINQSLKDGWVCISFYNALSI
ncbi:MAG: 50S ribosomal protein L11 methyltransferase [Saprospiraceae bacterium]|jgi:ribosomal protein L11 methyltransferase|nr:50S ribosomal protein L11 methyltransferase [Saprospiraceae bacterium]